MRSAIAIVIQKNATTDSADVSMTCAIMFFELNSKSTRSIVVDVKIEGHPLNMEVDTGANVSITPKNVWDQSWSDVQLSKSPVQLRTFTGEPLTVIGEALVNVQYKNQEIQEKLIVVENGANPLLGRNLLQGGIRLDWPNLFAHKLFEPSILDEFPSVFAQGPHIEANEYPIPNPTDLLASVKSHPREISKRFGSLASCFAKKHIQVQYSITSSQSTHKFDIKSFTSSSITSTTTTFIHEVQRHQPSTKTPTKEQNGDK